MVAEKEEEEELYSTIEELIFEQTLLEKEKKRLPAVS